MEQRSQELHLGRCALGLNESQIDAAAQCRAASGTGLVGSLMAPASSKPVAFSD